MALIPFPELRQSPHVAHRHEASAALAPRDTLERQKIMHAFDLGVIASREADTGESFTLTITTRAHRRCEAIAHVARVLSMAIEEPGRNHWAVSTNTGNATAKLEITTSPTA